MERDDEKFAGTSEMNSAVLRGVLLSLLVTAMLNNCWCLSFTATKFWLLLAVGVGDDEENVLYACMTEGDGDGDGDDGDEEDACGCFSPVGRVIF